MKKDKNSEGVLENEEDNSYDLISEEEANQLPPALSTARFSANGTKGRLTGTDIKHYSQFLARTVDQNKKFQYTQMLSTGVTRFWPSDSSDSSNNAAQPTTEKLLEQYLKAVISLESDDIIFIPISLKASKWNPFAEDHVTLLIINKNKKSIEYYDSKGGNLSIEKRELVHLPGMTGENLLKKIIESVCGSMQQPIWMKVDHKVYQPEGFWATVLGAIGLSGLGHRLSSHQGAFNRSNCGVFVCRAMSQYLKGDFEEMTKNLPKTFDMRKIRQEMVGNITNLPSSKKEESDSPSALVPGLFNRGSSSSLLPKQNPTVQEKKRPSQAPEPF